MILRSSLFSKSLVSREHWILNVVSLKCSTKVFGTFIPFERLNKAQIMDSVFALWEEVIEKFE